MEYKHRVIYVFPAARSVQTRRQSGPFGGVFIFLVLDAVLSDAEGNRRTRLRGKNESANSKHFYDGKCILDLIIFVDRTPRTRLFHFNILE